VSSIELPVLKIFIVKGSADSYPRSLTIGSRAFRFKILVEAESFDCLVYIENGK